MLATLSDMCAVLNLIINGLSSKQDAKKVFGDDYDVLNLIINGLSSKQIKEKKEQKIKMVDKVLNLIINGLSSKL